ncbi:MAG: hypothetical protein ACJ72Z_10510, partial [Pyrinomonadaceae bacterium]
MVEVRIAIPDDSAAIAEVLLEAFGAYRDEYTPEAFAIVTPSADEIAKRSDEGPQWVASLDGKIVGTVSVTVE